MTTVAEFIEYLKTLPPETDVQVVESDGYYAKFVDLEIDENTDFTDMTGNPFAKGKPYENSKTLYLGLD
jgi:hypothetical protein